jgi:Fe-S-cluster-containing hydrogenase component 2
MVKKIVGVKEKCIGCRICVLTCSLYNEGVFNPKRARLAIESGYNAKDWPKVCFQCEDAPCAEVCPVDAIVKDEDTGIWKILKDECTACGDCIYACDYDAIFFEPNKNFVIKCELCEGTVCKDSCPNDALVIRG